MVLYKKVLLGFILVVFISSSCQKNTYPCPDIHGGTEVVKAEDLKKNEPKTDENGRLVNKPYSHPGMKKKRR